jgi:hypothetical protein
MGSRAGKTRDDTTDDTSQCGEALKRSALDVLAWGL